MSHTRLTAQQGEKVNAFIKHMVESTIAMEFHSTPLTEASDIMSEAIIRLRLRTMMFCALHGYCPCVCEQIVMTAVASIASTIAKLLSKEHDFPVVLVDDSADMVLAPKGEGNAGRN